MKTADSLINEIVRIASDICSVAPQSILDNVIHQLKISDNNLPAQSILSAIQSDISGDLYFLFEFLINLSNAHMTWKELGWSLEFASRIRAIEKQNLKAEVIWTGPKTDELAFRRIDQVLYDAIENAKSRILMVTFAAYKIEKLTESIKRALSGNVKVKFILEFSEESDNQLSFSAINAIDEEILKQSEIFYWPRDMRECNEKGHPGKLHAKCAVIDDSLIISSANLTDDAFNRNMEMGVLLRSRKLADSVYGHFGDLMKGNILRRHKSL
jgi:cardiolipin synthase A/B